MMKQTLLYHNNCTELLPRLLKGANRRIIVVTDPPYGVTDHAWDVIVPSKQWMVGVGAVVTASQPYVTQLIAESALPFRHESIWVKNCVTNAMNAARMPMRRHENVLVFGDCAYFPQKRKRSAKEMSRLNKQQRLTMEYANPDSVLEFDAINNRSSERLGHPSQKPEELFVYLLRTYTDSDDLIVDPFMGTGTTGAACQTVGRDFIGVEMDEVFFKMAKERLAA